MSDLPWVRFEAADWIASEDVRFLTPAERGVLIDLMAHAWVHGSIPADEGRLTRLLTMTPRQCGKIWPSLRALFVDHPTESGRLVHPALELQRQHVEARRRVLAESGRRGAEKRWSGVAKVADEMKPGKGHPIGQAMGGPSRADGRERERKKEKKTDGEAAPSPSPRTGRSARLDEKQPDGRSTPSDEEKWNEVRAEINRELQDGDRVEKTGDS